MEKEELKSKVDEQLGSTRLTLSERTINGELEDALEDITEDAQVDDKFVARLVKRLKRMDGNLHNDVGEENRKYKEQFEKDWKDKHPEGNKDKDVDGGGKDEPAWFKAYREAQEAKLKALEDAQKEKDAKAEKESLLKQIREGVKDLFKNAGIEPNTYILNQTMRDVEIPEKDANVKGIIKDVEKDYYKNLKEAGLEDTMPKFGSKRNTDKTDELWERKQKKERFGKYSEK